MRKPILTAGTVTLAILLLFLLAGAIPVDHNRQLVIFKTPAFLTAVVACGLLMLAACFQRRPMTRQIAFFLTHAGGVVILAGALTGWIAGRQIDGIRLPVAPDHAIAKLRGAGGADVDLGFTLAVTNFTVTHYEPVYALYRPQVPHPRAATDYAFVQTVDPRRPLTLARTPAGPVPPDLLRSGEEWQSSVVLTNGWVLQQQAPVPRWFEAAVLVNQNGVIESRRLAVNHPLTLNGWRLYLVSYSSTSLPYVELSFKHDPGRPLVIGGIWSVLLGVAVLCLRLPVSQEGRHEPS